MTTVKELPAGFADKVQAAQSTFRSVMDAMARPGSVHRIVAAAGTPAPMMRGSAAIALTLFDHDTPIWLDPHMSATSDVAKWLKFHTSAPVLQDSSICSFALIGDPGALASLDRFSFGSNEYPDRSTTLILQVESLAQGSSLELRGPGIDGAAEEVHEEQHQHDRQRPPGADCVDFIRYPAARRTRRDHDLAHLRS